MKHRAAIIGGDETSHDVRLFLLGRTRAAEFGGRQVKIPRLGLVLAAFLLLDSSKMRATREAAAVRHACYQSTTPMLFSACRYSTTRSVGIGPYSADNSSAICFAECLPSAKFNAS